MGDTEWRTMYQHYTFFKHASFYLNVPTLAGAQNHEVTHSNWMLFIFLLHVKGQFVWWSVVFCSNLGKYPYFWLLLDFKNPIIELFFQTWYNN